MKKEYKDYLSIIKGFEIRETALVIGASEDVLRKYVRGETYPRLPIAVILEDKFDIPCKFWILNHEKNK
ncbi:MAG: hypothetical protein COB61_005830 [Thiotrichales bacterium]|nr:hypothetical protein [Thiotrichales bacterium]